MCYCRSEIITIHKLSQEGSRQRIIRLILNAVIFQVNNSLQQAIQMFTESQQTSKQSKASEKITYLMSYLRDVQAEGDKAEVGRVYNNLGNAYKSLGNFNKAIEYHNLHLTIAKDLGDKAGEGRAYGNLGIAFNSLGDLSKALEYHTLDLSVAKDVGDKAGEGSAYCNLGNVFQSLGIFNKAVEYHNLHLTIAKDLGDKAGEGRAYGNLGIAYRSLSDFNKAVEYHNLHLTIAKDLGDKVGEGRAYHNLGNAFHSLGDFNKAVECYNLHVTITKDLGDKAWEGRAYGNLGNAYRSLGDVNKGVKYHKLELSIAKSLENKAGEGCAYQHLGNDFDSLGDANKAVECYNFHLTIAKDLGDKAEEGGAYGNLGNAFQSLGDFNKAIEYHNLNLTIAKHLGDKAGKGRAYGNLGIAFQSLGDFNKAVEYHKLRLAIAKDLGDKAMERGAYGNLGTVFRRLGDFKKAVEYHTQDLRIAKELGNKAAEGRAYGNLGNAIQSLGDFNKAVEYHNLRLTIAKDLGDKAGEGRAYGSLGVAFQSLDVFNKAVEYHNLHLAIAKDLGDKTGEGGAYCNLGTVFEIIGDFNKAVECYQGGVKVLNDVRNFLRSRDEWKISFRNLYNPPYSGLYRVLLKQGKIKEALFAAEKGRAQALNDLIELQYASKSDQSGSRDREEKKDELLSCTSSSTAFLSIDNKDNGISIWVLSKGEPVYHRKKELDVSKNGARTWESLIQSVYINTGVRAEIRCENRSLDAFIRKDVSSVERSAKKGSQPPIFKGNPLAILYNYIIAPVADLVQGDELIVVPDGPLWLAPYAALLDRNSKYLCESFRIRLIPSLTSLKMIADCSSEYHSRSGALLVGDPYVGDITNSTGKKILEQLPFAKKEVEMIGQILKVTPLTREKATKDEVLKGLRSVALVHIAAHGRMETGEIALTPNPRRQSRIPKEEDFLLTMADVMSVRLRARLVVLSCCHSGRGEINPEGVVGIARAFMGAGARSVLVSLWAIDDEATMEFMRSFYHHLLEGRSASESLNQAMKCLRESDEYSDVKYWAPFVLVGDDVTLQFNENE